MKADWTVAEAKARLTEVVDQALTDGPQTITRNGTKVVVVVSNEEWERKTGRTDSLAEFFATSPLRNSKLELDRRVPLNLGSLDPRLYYTPPK